MVLRMHDPVFSAGPSGGCPDAGDAGAGPRSLAARWDEVTLRAARAAVLAVGCDFDGTLAPLQDRPEEVALPEPARKVLERLIALPDVTVAIASGRALADLQRRVPLPGLLLIGNHGFESRFPGGPVRLLCEGADLEAFRAVAGAVEVRTRGIPGVWLEDKGVTASLHHRRAAPGDRSRVLAAAREAAADVGRPVRLVEGNGVVEIRPAEGPTKGQALLGAFADARVPATAMLWYFGDDATDEDVFAAMPSGAVTVRVGAAGGPTAARYAAEDPDEVVRLLGRLADLLQGMIS